MPALRMPAQPRALTLRGADSAYFNGNVQTGNVRTVDRISGDDFLRWRTLADGISPQPGPP
ncbi:hypothetical protein HTY52_05470 [Cupriavidus taiwanensis]|nr:hypothetical protein [Cupriavidus taiwanensis]NSX13523.1 hypothetical protein [Cupriavidus taiwanensis]